MVCIWWTLRGLARISERSLLAGTITTNAGLLAGEKIRAGQQPRRSRAAAKSGGILFGLLGLALIVAAAAKKIDPAGAFFGAGAAILIACLCLITVRLRRTGAVEDAPSIARLGIRNTTERPGRSVLAIAVIASATFILISVDAFRRGDIDASDRHSGTGGYPLLVDLMVPLVHDPNSREGRDALGIGSLPNVTHRALPGPAGRRCELPQSVRADQSAHPRRQRQIHRRWALRVPGIARVDRRRPRQSLAPAERSRSPTAPCR